MGKNETLAVSAAIGGYMVSAQENDVKQNPASKRGGPSNRLSQNPLLASFTEPGLPFTDLLPL